VHLTLADLLHDAVPYALPLTRTFRGVDVREGMLIRGPSGWGEFAPFDDYSPVRAARWLAAAAEAAFGVWPQPRRHEIPVNAIIPAVPAADAAALARAAVLELGCTTIKIKVAAAGDLLADDEARVALVRDAADSAMRSANMAGRAHLRIDANGGWSLDEAVRALSRLTAYDLDYVEQPCASADDVALVRSRIDIPIVVDEAVRVDDLPPERIREIADAIVLKVGPAGGVAAALEQAERIGLPVIVSGALDTTVGLAAGLALAAALPGDEHGHISACGLGTGTLLAEDVVAATLVPDEGMLVYGRMYPDLDALMRARARLGDDRAREWRQRAADAWLAGGEALIADLPESA
jgi:o-succinylbenzoate synthase